MILRALYDYYKRSDNMPPKGLEYKEIGYLIVVDKNGKFLRLESRMRDKKHAQEFLVKKSVSRTSEPKANYLYDNSKYVFGYPDEDDGKKPLKTERCFNVFKDKITSILKRYPENDDIKAIELFYRNDRNTIVGLLKGDSLWAEIENNLNEKFWNFSFLIEGDTKIVAEKQELIATDDETSVNKEQICLVIGNTLSRPVETTTATMIPKSQPTAKLVSFQVNSGYDSYGKKQGYNAPISEEAEFAYTTALNALLHAESRNKFMIGNRTFVFWASNANEAGKQTEQSVWDMFGFSDSTEDDPNRKIEQVRKVFESIYTGKLKTSLDDRFYILGLAPNAARIAVTYWADISLKEFAQRINRHFKDMEIVDGRKEKTPYMGLRAILSAIIKLDEDKQKTSKINDEILKLIPNMPEAVIKSIFQGLPYPQPLFAGCVRRIRAEQKVTITRIAIIKAYLNRLNNKDKIEIMLDKDNTNQGYLCGRLFAVLEKIQEDANGQSSRSSIRDYMNAASATPASVFATILNLSMHHYKKLNEGSIVFFEKKKQEIIEKISADGFPAHLDLQDQGRFFVGYYHQKQSFYTKNEEKIEN